MRAHEVLSHLLDHPGRGPAALAREFGANPRAAQRILSRLREGGLVRAEGDHMDRRYYITSEGEATLVRATRPAPAPPPVEVRNAAETPDRGVLRRISALLTTHGIPTTEEGRILTLEERVRRALDERDAVDTRIDDELRKRALGAFAEDPRLRYLASVVRPDDLLRTVVEAGVAALTGSQPGR